MSESPAGGSTTSEPSATDPAPLATQGRSTHPKPPTKLARLAAALRAPEGATMAELGSLTGWQAHSIRAALSGLRKSDQAITTAKREDGTTMYRIAAVEAPAEAAPSEERSTEGPPEDAPNADAGAGA